DGLEAEVGVDFRSMRRVLDLSDLPSGLRDPKAPDQAEFRPKPLSFFDKLMPGANDRFAAAEKEGDAKYHAAVAQHERLLAQREEAVRALQASVDAHNAEVDEFESGVGRGDPDALKAYYELVLS